MKSFLSAVFVSLMLSIVTTVGIVRHTTPDYSTLRQATWQLTNDVGSCSGVFIKPNEMLTAAHCDGPNLKVGMHRAIVIKKDEARDLMLLYVDGWYNYVPVAKDGPQVDDRLITIGYPLGMGQVLTEGRMQAIIRGEMNPNYELSSAQSVFGNSGGPVFAVKNGRYMLVGIVSAGAVAPVFGMIPNIVPHLSFFVSTEAINKFLNE